MGVVRLPANDLEVVPERGKADSVVGRYDAADAAEGRTFEVFQLDAERANRP